MARLSLTARLNRFNRRNFEKVILDTLSNQFSRAGRQIREIVNEQIRDAVDRSANLFQPHRRPNGSLDIVGQLGIGEDGSPDFEKLRNIHKLLYPRRNGIAKTSISFSQRNFGRIKYIVDTDRLYEAREATYTSFSGGQFVVVKWLSNFINGIVVPTHAYIDSLDPSFNQATSRTGIGHMIKLGARTQVPRQQFVFRGVGNEATFDVLFNRIELALRRRELSNRIRNVVNNA